MMGDDDDDPGGDTSAWGPPSLAFSTSTPSQSQSISCKSCTLQFVPIDSRYKYCPDCKAKMPSRPKASATKRDSSAALFSLQDTNQSKQHKDDNFPFQFDKAFEMDVDTFLALDSAVQTLKLKSFFAKLEEEAICFKSEKALMVRKIEKLEKEIDNKATLHTDLNQAKKDLLTAKLSLADKDIRLFELQSSVKSAKTSSLAPPKPASNPPTSNPSTWKNTPLYAEVPKRPVLIAHVGGSACLPMSEISNEKIDKLFDLDGNGPVVQNIKKIDGRVILSFLDVASRDKAQVLFNNNAAQNVFRSVSVPQKQFPALVRFRELKGITHLKGTENKDARGAQEKDLSRRLIAENPVLRGNLESVRVLHQRPNSNSFLVRIAFSSKPFCENLIKRGRILLDGLTHAVVESDPSKEVRHCSKCQNYGHIHHFCKSATPVCGKCSQTHATSSCPSTPKDFKCANCLQNHQVGSSACPALAKAVAQYLAYISSE
jgi:hypothetical protein